MTRVLICGDRNWTNVQMIEELMSHLGPDDVVIEGMAAGADTIAGRVARKLGCQLLEFPARWGLYGKRAGPMRNEQMLNEGTPEEVWAFHDDITSSKGTASMIYLALKAHVPVYLHHKNGGGAVRWISSPSVKKKVIGME